MSDDDRPTYEQMRLARRASQFRDYAGDPERNPIPSDFIVDLERNGLIKADADGYFLTGAGRAACMHIAAKPWGHNL